ncbi:hypothetical protein RU94_GL002185 [Enterococcus asini]|nr:hypothetical protein RU94_GL002185 [Enterococcus asini]
MNYSGSFFFFKNILNFSLGQMIAYFSHNKPSFHDTPRETW